MQPTRLGPMQKQCSSCARLSASSGTCIQRPRFFGRRLGCCQRSILLSATVNIFVMATHDAGMSEALVGVLVAIVDSVAIVALGAVVVSKFDDAFSIRPV